MQSTPFGRCWRVAGESRAAGGHPVCGGCGKGKPLIIAGFPRDTKLAGRARKDSRAAGGHPVCGECGKGKLLIIADFLPDWE
jgi:hypothetical protein